MTQTTIILESDDTVPVLISGLIVRVFSTVGVFVTSGTTNGSGQAVFDLPDADYDLLFFKSGVSLLDGMPQRITVDAADTDNPPNTFKVKGHISTLPESPDPMLCRISGTILGADGRRSRDIRFNLEMCPEIAILSNYIISPQDIVEIRPDNDGYYEFNLLRKMRYTIYLPQLNELFRIEPAMVYGLVPDLPAIALKDFLFPVPVNATFGSLVLALSANGVIDDSIECEITYSDGSVNSNGRRPVPPVFTNVVARSSDDDVADVTFQTDKIAITPKAAGTANITIERVMSDQYLIYDPLPVFVTQTLVVTVT
mgnify:CR=1 FL=1